MNLTISKSIEKAVELMSNESAGALIKALIAYSDGREQGSDELSADVRMVYTIITAMMAEVASKRAYAGRKGGLAKSSKSKQTVAKPSKSKQNLAKLAFATDPSSIIEDNKEINSPLDTTSPQSNSPLSTTLPQSLDGTERERKEKLKEKQEKVEAVQKPTSVLDDPGVQEAFAEFVKMRKTIRKPLTDNAVVRAKDKLAKMSGGDVEKAIRILHNTTDHCWQDLYAPRKEEDTSQSPSYSPSQPQRSKPNTFNDFDQRKPGDRDYVDLDAMLRKEL